MTVRLILQMSDPSHALTVCEPWTRILVETERPNGEGHVIGGVLRLRKTQSEGGVIIIGIEVEQRQEDPTTAQPYLDACAWWLHRAPFGVDRLPLHLVAGGCSTALVRVNGWHATVRQSRRRKGV